MKSWIAILVLAHSSLSPSAAFPTKVCAEEVALELSLQDLDQPGAEQAGGTSQVPNDVTEFENLPVLNHTNLDQLKAWPAPPFRLDFPGSADMALIITQVRQAGDARQTRFLQYISEDLIPRLTRPGTKPQPAQFNSGALDVSWMYLKEDPLSTTVPNSRDAIAAGITFVTEKMKDYGAVPTAGQFRLRAGDHERVAWYETGFARRPPPTPAPWPSLPKDFPIPDASGASLNINQVDPVPGDGFDRYHGETFLQYATDRVKSYEEAGGDAAVPLRWKLPNVYDLGFKFQPNDDYPEEFPVALEIQALTELLELVRDYGVIDSIFYLVDTLNRRMASGYFTIPGQDIASIAWYCY